MSGMLWLSGLIQSNMVRACEVPGERAEVGYLENQYIPQTRMA